MRRLTDEELLELESRQSFLFFWEEANDDPDSPGYGLIRDRAPGQPDMTSVASVGFGLTALAIGAERGWVPRGEAHERARGTMVTLLRHAEQRHGFFFHFLDWNTAKQYGGCEVSVIDTAICICGVLAAGEYFGGYVRELAQDLYERVEWDWYRNPETNQFYMGYSDKEKRHFGAWDHYAEQFMMYFLGAASPTHPVPADMFDDFVRYVGYYGGYGPVIHSTGGALFVYQFSHAWFDFRGRKDKFGVDWFENSVQATLANRQFCIDHRDRSKTFGANSWGLTACDGPRGYSGGYGANPNTTKRDYVDGTIPPCGAAGSIVFAPEESIAALRHYYEHFPHLWGKYGFQDAYNLDVSPAWFAEDVIGIDKGISLLMIENYRAGFVWRHFMNVPAARRGMALCMGMPAETLG
ncbi:glucoamylase family protein [Paenibacillus humicola]|uniref:glucoamylase family protein n=1 Tax=Paenibacillus humicola TaxID=3110540 RepID=UPI00237A480D|nr:glucoamylase family protein [Paenibacillus humicola]